MNFVTFVHEGNEQTGILHDEKVMPLDQMLKRSFANMIDLIISFQTR